MKNLLITMIALIGVNTYADCAQDVKEMYKQIAQYGSISTKGCSFNARKLGITKVDDVSPAGKTCNAACYRSSVKVACGWTQGNWGNTLSCTR